MYQGFYNLASGMLTQSRNLNVISNNMVNLQTAGYKNDTMVTSTFQEEMLYRTGRRNKAEQTELAVASKIRTATQTYVDYSQGSYEETGGTFDFALGGDGFFCILTPSGEVQYTRNGSFAVDGNDYLVLNDLGQVLDTNGQPIQITGEEISVNENGHITAQVVTYNNEGELLGVEDRDFGTLAVVDFADHEALHREDNGLFSTDQAQIQITGGNGLAANGEETVVLSQTLEKSNVDMVEEMSRMISSQRALQSGAQILKMYDTIMSKSSTEIGNL